MSVGRAVVVDPACVSGRGAFNACLFGKIPPSKEGKTTQSKRDRFSTHVAPLLADAHPFPSYTRLLRLLRRRVLEDGSGRMGGENDEGVRAAGSGIAMRKVCMHMRAVLPGVRTAQAWVMGRMFGCWVWLDRGETMHRIHIRLICLGYMPKFLICYMSQIYL